MDSSGTMSKEMVTLLTSITASFTASFNLCVDRIIDSIEKKLTTRMDIQATEHFDLNKKVERIEKVNQDLAAENANLKDSIKNLTSRLDNICQNVDDLDQYSRNVNLLVHGVPSSNDPAESDLTDRLVGYLNSNLGLTLKHDDISTLHRLPKPATQSSTTGATSKPAPVIVQFLSRSTRNTVLSKRKLLKGKSVVITEQLTAKKMSLLRKANEFVTSGKLQSAWTHDGKILIKTLNNHTMAINTPAQLDQF